MKEFVKDCTACAAKAVCRGRCIADPAMHATKSFTEWSVNLVFPSKYSNEFPGRTYEPTYDLPYFYSKSIGDIPYIKAYGSLSIGKMTPYESIQYINRMSDPIAQQDSINFFYEEVDKYNKMLYNKYMQDCLCRQAKVYMNSADTELKELFSQLTPASQAKYFEVLSALNEEELRTFINDRGVSLPEEAMLYYKEWKRIPCYPVKEYSDYGKAYYYRKEDLPGYIPEYKTLHCRNRQTASAYSRKQLLVAVAEAVLLEQILGSDVFETRKGLDNNDYTFKSIRQMDVEEYDRVFKETYISNDYMSTFYGEGDSVDDDEAETEAYFSYPEETETESDEEFYNQFDDEEDNVEE